MSSDKGSRPSNRVVVPTYRGRPWTLRPDAKDDAFQRAARAIDPRSSYDTISWIAERRPISYYRYGDLEEMQVILIPRSWANQGRAPSGYYLVHAEPDGYLQRLYGPYATEMEARRAASVELADDDTPEAFSSRSPRQHVIDGFVRTRSWRSTTGH